MTIAAFMQKGANMLDDHEVTAFLATADAAGMKPFYGDVLGLRLLEDTPFALVFAMRETTLRIQKLQAFTPAAHTALGWSVKDIGAAARALAGKGVRFERFEGMPQDELGVWLSPSGAKIAWFKDPSGNLLSLTEA
jgi:catechol 2,3-dioxygenase-like lactoylglutathione lyase family enzyme